MALNLADEFAVPPADRTTMWARVGLILETFSGRSGGEATDGFAERSLADAEGRLGVPLPTALREGYQRFGRCPGLSRQDILLGLEDLHRDGTHLVFRIENQNCAHWAVNLADGTDDPQVHLRLAGDRHWLRDGGVVAGFFLHMALYEAAFAETFNDNCEVDAGGIATLAKTFLELAVPRFLFWPNPDGPPHRYFGDDGLLVADHARTWLWVVALSQDALDRVRHLIPCDWVMDSTT